MRVSKGPLFKVADKDVHGSVRDLTAIFKHDDNVFVVFFINHGGQQCFSPGYDKKEVLDFFRIKEKEFNEKLSIEWKLCENCKKESETVFYCSARYGIKWCGNCMKEKYV